LQTGRADRCAEAELFETEPVVPEIVVGDDPGGTHLRIELEAEILTERGVAVHTHPGREEESVPEADLLLDEEPRVDHLRLGLADRVDRGAAADRLQPRRREVTNAHRLR